MVSLREGSEFMRWGKANSGRGNEKFWTRREEVAKNFGRDAKGGETILEALQRWGRKFLYLT